jgi:glutamate N-acetyltransferase/amino-acid N-acetyltransferase
MVDNMPALAESVKANKLDALDAAASIMTTDQWPKVRRAALPGGASVVGIAKGAGMVEPNMATMLSVLLTDARVSRSTLQRALERAVNAPARSILAL